MAESDDPPANRERLALLLSQLDSDLALARESAGTVELDQSSVGRLSRMDALQQQAIAQAGMQRLAVHRRRIVAASSPHWTAVKLARTDAAASAAVRSKPIGWRAMRRRSSARSVRRNAERRPEPAATAAGPHFNPQR